MVRERAYAALDTLIGEVSAVFQSSPFVHIGCDEASLGGIETTPEVKAFMEKHRLPSTGAVFNYFVNRLHAIVKKHGKRMIVWEGASLEPAAPPKDVIFMPWVGGAGAAADLIKRGYAVINAPWGAKTPYIDPYLVNGAQLRRGEPLLLGATSLLWERPQENAVPFLRQTGALRNEPTYNPHTGRDYPDFLRRLQSTDVRLDRLLCGFAFAAQGVLDSRVYLRTDAIFAKAVTATLASSLESDHLRYTLDGSQPTLASQRYTGPIRIAKTTTLKAQWFGEGLGASGRILSREFQQAPVLAHDAVGAAVTLSPQNPGYFGPRPKVGANFLQHVQAGIRIPQAVDVLVSDDGRTFRKAATINHVQNDNPAFIKALATDLGGVQARFVRLVAHTNGQWLFVDEVFLNPEEEP